MITAEEAKIITKHKKTKDENYKEVIELTSNAITEYSKAGCSSTIIHQSQFAILDQEQKLNYIKELKKNGYDIHYLFGKPSNSIVDRDMGKGLIGIKIIWE